MLFCAAAFPPDGKLFALASYDATIRLWDPMTGICHSTLEGHWEGAIAITFSPDGKHLESRSTGGQTRSWCIGAGEEDQAVHTTESIACELPIRSPCTLHVNDPWVCYGIKRLFWPHSDYRVTCFTARNNIVASGQKSGRVSFVGFDLAEVPSGEPFDKPIYCECLTIFSMTFRCRNFRWWIVSWGMQYGFSVTTRFSLCAISSTTSGQSQGGRCFIPEYCDRHTETSSWAAGSLCIQRL